MLLAKATKIPELALDEEEADKLAEAAANVARHYNINISQKTLDWTNFATAMSAIYGTRLMAIATKKKMELAHGHKHAPFTNAPAPAPAPPPKPQGVYDPLSPENMARNRSTVDKLFETARGNA